MNSSIRSIFLILLVFTMCFHIVFAEDFDNDGMPDAWERENGLQIDVVDSNLDPDYDDLTNAEEFAHKTNPKSADSDGDGMIDGAEISSGYDPKDSNSREPLVWASTMNIVMIILFVLLLLVILIYYLETKKTVFHKKIKPQQEINNEVSAVPTAPVEPRKILSRDEYDKRIRMRKKIFSSFNYRPTTQNAEAKPISAFDKLKRMGQK